MIERKLPVATYCSLFSACAERYCYENEINTIVVLMLTRCIATAGNEKLRMCPVTNTEM